MSLRTTQSNNSGTNVIIKETLAQGDCFYSGIYRALKDRNELLNKTAECLELDNSNENIFIVSFRNKIASKVLSGYLPKTLNKNGELDIYDVLISRLGETVETYKQVVKSYPDWFINEFGENGDKLGDRDNFIKKLAEHIATPGKWVGEIEVELVKEELLNCNIELVIKSKRENKLSQKSVSGNDIIYLYNPNEQHYEYFSFANPVNKPLSRKRKVKVVAPSANLLASIAKAQHANQVQSTCSQLYNPCTREPIDNIEQLEKIIRELKREKNETPIGLYGLNNETSNYDFLTNIFTNQNISLDDMVSFKLSEGSQIGSDIYEVLCRLFVFFGGIENVNPRQDGNYKFVQKIEEAHRVYDSPIEALKCMKCKATRASGISDITLLNVRNDKKEIKGNEPYCEVDCDVSYSDNIKTYLMSVKWYTKEKSAEHYDLEKLFTAAEKITGAEQKPIDIIVFLKSKRDFEIAHNRAYRQYTRELAKTFFGWNEDVKPFLEEVRKSIFEAATISGKSPKEFLETTYLSSSVSKPILSLQLHQDIIVKGICDTIETNDDNLYLVGVLPRGGKTYIAGGIMREYLNRTKITNLNIFWLTAAPNETLGQVRDDLLTKFQDFNDFEFIEVKAVADFKKTKHHTVYFCSSQLLVAMQKEKGKKREFLQNLLSGVDNLGLIFFDEAHKTGTGDKTSLEINTIIQSYRSNRLPLIFLTATYYSILLDYQIQQSHTFIWDYTDILSCRALATKTEQEDALERLRQRFSTSLVDTVIEQRLANTETLETMAKAYIDFPDLYFISADFQEEAKKRFEEQKQYRPDSGFSMASIFGIKQGITIKDVKTADNKVRKDAYKIFANIQNPKNMISLITPHETFNNPEVVAEPGGAPLAKEEGALIEPTLLGRINKISSDVKSRFRLDEHPTMLMFMPTGGEGTNILYLLCAWASLLLSHKWWNDNYEVLCVVADEPIGRNAIAELLHLNPAAASGIHLPKSNRLKEEILTLERRLHCEKNKGLIILAGEKLSMGISLPCTDVVFLFNEKKSPDDIIQKMYRALTPSRDKKSSFIVDLNPVRTLAAIYGYTRASHTKINNKSELLDIIYDTYSWDSDIFDYNIKKGSNSRPLTYQERLRELLELAEKEPKEYRINEDIGGFEKKLATNITKKVDELGLLPILKDIVIGVVPTKSGITFADKANVIVKSGKLVMRLKKEKAENEEVANEVEDTIEEVVLVQNFTDAVSDFIKYLAITSTADDLDGAIAEFETNVVNNGDKSLQENVMQLLKARDVLHPYVYLPTTKEAIKNPINNSVIVNLFVDAIKKYSPNTSKEIFRQMRGKVSEPSTRKNEVLKIIHKRLTPRNTQKKDFGEVFTPIELIEDMISHLPNSDWSNPNLKWLDPANGIGNFPVVLFYKLDKGLEKWQPNSNKRRKHIIENMLYMMELQSSNNRISRNIFKKLCGDCEPNIWTVDTLKQSKEDILKHFGIEEIHRIVGNPPFQAYQDAADKRGGGDELYMKFVKMSIELLDPNGYLVFVHPPSWRKPEYSEGRKVSKNAGMFELMTHSNQMHYLEIHDAKDGQKTFKASTRYDFYVLQKKEATEKTTVKDQLGDVVEIDLSKYGFLPNFNIKNVMKLVAADDDEKCDLGSCILFSASAYETRKDWVSLNKSAKYKYPLVHTTPKSGPTFYYSSVDDKGFFGINKVIFGDSGINKPIIDLFGNYGMTQHAIGIAIKNKKEADMLSDFLISNYFTNILKACMWANFQIDWRLFTYFKNKFWETEYNKDEKMLGGGDFISRFNKTRKHRRS